MSPPGSSSQAVGDARPSPGRSRKGDIPADVFHALRRTLWNARGVATPFHLDLKGSTQDDPFDSFVWQLLAREQHGSVIRAPGPLISPDMVALAPGAELVAGRRIDTSVAAGIEVKKLERLDSRVSGLDFSSTPPCGTIKVYDGDNHAVMLPGFYILAVVSPVSGRSFRVSTLCLVDGNALNTDTALYDAAISPRRKQLALGSFADGINRLRPMFVFPNPLSWSWLREKMALIHRRDDLAGNGLVRAGEITRSAGRRRDDQRLYCYLDERDARRIGQAPDAFSITDPFLVPRKRVETTSQRGRFVIR